MDGIGPWQRQCGQSMAHLMMGDDFALLRIEQPVPFFEAGYDALNRAVEIFNGDRICLSPGGQKRRPVDKISEIGARNPPCQGSNLLDFDFPVPASPSSDAP